MGSEKAMVGSKLIAVVWNEGEVIGIANGSVDCATSPISCKGMRALCTPCAATRT